jgi:hypothetical protein
LMYSIAEVCLVGSVLLIFSGFCVVIVFCVEHANYYTTDVVRLLMSINSMAHVVSERKVFLKVWTIRNKIDSSIRTKWGIHVEYLFLGSHKMVMINTEWSLNLIWYLIVVLAYCCMLLPHL